MSIIERRDIRVPFGCETRMVERNGRPMIVGYAAVFNLPSQRMRTSSGVSFFERIKPGAFSRAISSPDVRALQNHDPNLLLGRSGAGTLRMREDARGLWYEVDPPNTLYAKDLLESLRRRDITGSSFGFVTLDDDWSEGPDGLVVRELRDVSLFDVGPVTFPAYGGSSTSVRCLADDDPASVSFERRRRKGPFPTLRQRQQLQRLRFMQSEA